MTKLHINDFPLLKSLSSYQRQFNPFFYFNSQFTNATDPTSINNNNNRINWRGCFGMGMNMRYEEVGMELSYIFGHVGSGDSKNNSSALS